MTPQQKIVTCAKCGQKMAIPPGYENTPGRCTKCGAVVNQPNRGQAPTAQQQAPPVQQQAPRAQQQAPPLPGLGPSPLDGEPIRLDQSILDDAPIQLNQSLLDGEPIQFQAPGGEDEGAPVQLADSLLEEIPMGVPRMSEVSKAEKKKFEKGELPRKLFFVALWTVGITIV
ncbi:MAG: hypothetical protein JXR94_16465, partial [Candidatus Hydrogenedentes bacterium]|nr:hypothetical protein [Candidatus Hydrogenedentota bacterium]